MNRFTVPISLQQRMGFRRSIYSYIQTILDYLVNLYKWATVILFMTLLTWGPRDWAEIIYGFLESFLHFIWQTLLRKTPLVRVILRCLYECGAGVRLLILVVVLVVGGETVDFGCCIGITAVDFGCLLLHC